MTPVPKQMADDSHLSPDDVVQKYRNSGLSGDVFEVVFDKPAKTLTISALVQERGEAYTAQEIADMREDLSVASFNRYRDDLIGLGVIAEAGKRGNAMTYRLDTDHPVAQLLMMLDDVLVNGQTPMRLSEQFLADSA